MEKMPIENWISSRLRAAEAMIRSMETHVRLLEKQRDYLKVWKNDQLQILEEQVKHLERQRCFLTLWKPDVHFGLDSKSSHVDVQLVAKDEGRVHAHKAILVRLVCSCLLGFSCSLFFSHLSIVVRSHWCDCRGLCFEFYILICLC